MSLNEQERHSLLHRVLSALTQGFILVPLSNGCHSVGSVSLAHSPSMRDSTCRLEHGGSFFIFYLYVVVL